MWQPYIDVIEEKVPEAVMVFDKFHIIRHLMDSVDKVRR
jgi:transposase